MLFRLGYVLPRLIGYSMLRSSAVLGSSRPISQIPAVPFRPPSSDTSDDEEEKRKRALRDVRMIKLSAAMIGAWVIGAFTYALIEFGSPEKDEKGEDISDEFGERYPALIARIMRTFGKIKENYQMIKDPTSDKLLPDTVTYPLYQPPYTLVVEHNGVLIHPEWSYKNGWRFKKRPGLDYFMSKVGYPVFELVIYTSDSTMTAAPILHGIDSQGNKLFAALFRENTRYKNGTHIKDLSCLNRDLSKVIIIDWDEKAYQLQPRNGIHRIPKWDGADDDRFLISLADFLEMLANSNVNDVRDVLDHYNQEVNPIAAFVDKQQHLLEKINPAKHDKKDVQTKII